MKISWKQRLLGVPERETRFATRGYEPCDPQNRDFLEKIIREFVAGYHLALNIQDTNRLVEKLDSSFSDHHVGFAYEGTGMYFAMLDLLLPKRISRLQEFADGVAKKHDYIVLVGAGFAIGRLPWGPLVLRRYMQKIHPLKAWCIPDGYGFHQGIFHHKRYIEQCQEPPWCIPRYARQLFDSGIGRSLWWVKGASPDRIQSAINRFPESRRAELWCGIGVACAYASGVGERDLLRLSELSGVYRLHFLSGIPFAATMRHHGKNSTPWTEQACRVLLNMTLEATASLVNRILAEAQLEEMSEKKLREQGYVLMRQRLVSRLQGEFDGIELRVAGAVAG